MRTVVDVEGPRYALRMLALTRMLLAAETATTHGGAAGPTPSLAWIAPFVAILLAIAVLPLVRRTVHWWEHNRNKLLVAAVLSAVTLAHYATRGFGVAHGGHVTEPGAATVAGVLHHAVVVEYVPFIVLLFSLYVISGGIAIRGDIRATPANNTIILAIGGLLASLVGTTGASMLLIRLLLKTNSERHRVVHTFVFFIFIVSNVGGSLLPIGDPPLFLGYLRGVPFLWTLRLWQEWAVCMGVLLAVYFVWDTWAYRHEKTRDVDEDRAHIEPIRMRGGLNFLWLLLVVAAVATLDAGKAFPGTEWRPPPHLREIVLLALVAVAWFSTPGAIRRENNFNFTAIAEVACLFIGIFITMQVPIELLHLAGPKLRELGWTEPWHFFWASGTLSSFLDNAPTYVVFFETANQLTRVASPHTITLLTGDVIRDTHLIAISCGAVFMGANTYIGNGPNFMVKSICEQSGVKMPSFFGYMAYSGAILVPLFVVLTLIFMR